jgi:hypothetical protein
MRPGPRRGHTAARTFLGGPVQLANHALSCFEGSEASVDELAGPVSFLTTSRTALAARDVEACDRHAGLVTRSYVAGRACSLLTIGATLWTDANSGQLASLSEMTLTANGHSIPNSGSFQRNPCSSVVS